MSVDAMARCLEAICALARIDGFRVAKIELVPLPNQVEERPRYVRRQSPREFASKSIRRDRRGRA